MGAYDTEVIAARIHGRFTMHAKPLPPSFGVLTLLATLSKAWTFLIQYWKEKTEEVESKGIEWWKVNGLKI